MAARRKIPLKELFPSGPVLSPARRAQVLTRSGPSGVVYRGAARAPFPVMPLQAFGVAYDLDLVVVDDSPDWDMHEYARVLTPEGAVWLCKDSSVDGLDQSIVAELDNIDTVLPEVPVERRYSNVTVQDQSAPGQIDLKLGYTNLKGQPVEVAFAGKMPSGSIRKRNSSTMGHSHRTLLVALDLANKTFAKTCRVSIGGVPQRMKKILGIVPFQLALLQTQAGLASGSWTARADGEGVRTEHVMHGASGALAAQHWKLTQLPGQEVLEQVHPWRTLRYTFEVRGEARELSRIDVLQYKRVAPACSVVFAPSLPDVRIAWSGPWRGAWIMDVNGQESHAVGEIEVASDAAGATLRVIPVAPRWTLDRPMRNTVRFVDGSVHVEAKVTPG